MLTLTQSFDLGKRMFKEFFFIDLTQKITAEMPTWNGSCGFCHHIKRDYDTGIRILKYEMHAAAGTHMDAPSHFFKDGKNIADFSLEELINPCCVIDVAKKRREDLVIGVNDLREYEEKYGKIPQKSCVIGFTGWQDFWMMPEKYRNVKEDGVMRFPHFSRESAEFLLERDVAGIGIDTLSPDAVDGDHPVHRLVLGAGKYIVENLCHLDAMPQKGSYIFVLPINIAVGTEASVRVIAAVRR